MTVNLVRKDGPTIEYSSPDFFTAKQHWWSVWKSSAPIAVGICFLLFIPIIVATGSLLLAIAFTGCVLAIDETIFANNRNKK